MVITVEPGLYFIPMLLEKKRAEGAPIDWRLLSYSFPLVESALKTMSPTPQGSGSRNLTRDAFANISESATP